MTENTATGSFQTTQIYERQRTQMGTEEEAKHFIAILEKHENLEVTTHIEEEYIPLPLNSWNKIVKYMSEMMKYALSYVIFSTTRTIEEFESREFLRRVLKKRTMIRDVFFNPDVKTSLHLPKVEFKSNEFKKFEKFFSKRKNHSSHIYPIDEINKELNDKENARKEAANAVREKSNMKVYKSPIREISFDKMKYEDDVKNLKAKSREKSPIRKFIFEENQIKNGKESVIEIVENDIKSSKKKRKNRSSDLLDIKRKQKQSTTTDEKYGDEEEEEFEEEEDKITFYENNDQNIKNKKSEKTVFDPHKLTKKFKSQDIKEDIKEENEYENEKKDKIEEIEENNEIPNLNNIDSTGRVIEKDSEINKNKIEIS